MLVTGKTALVGAHLRDDHQRGGHVNAVDAGQVHCAHLVELGAQIEPRSVAGTPTFFALGRPTFAALQGLQLRFDPGVAFGQLGAAEVKRVQRLFQGEEGFAAG